MEGLDVSSGLVTSQEIDEVVKETSMLLFLHYCVHILKQLQGMKQKTRENKSDGCNTIRQCNLPSI